MGSSASPPSTAFEHSRRGRGPHKDCFYEDRALPYPSERAQDAREGSVNSHTQGSSPKTLDFISTV